ncbi:chemotaxis protein CheW [Ramlibacter sp. 2FC]|uniref:chemotaxis protein CheW n=1 Tax=Ramlibacter sp. 2FC TaxID=2502188 RepID=UPI00201DA20D|nr:chemotaxis protein CheW [Ramlibacter sp. 2FC]
MNDDTPITRAPAGPGALDWSSVRQRMEAARLAFDRAGMHDPETTQRILKARAQALAKAPEPELSEQLDLLAFRLAWEDYAVESRFVREVCVLEQLTPVPSTPPFVLGLVNLHGEILSVIDLRTFFELPAQGLTDLNKLIVLAGEGMRFGILADAITGMLSLPVADIQPALPTLTGIRAKYLRGVTPGRTAVLDAGLLLADDSLVVRDEPVAPRVTKPMQGEPR